MVKNEFNTLLSISLQLLHYHVVLNLEWPVGTRLHNCSVNGTCTDTVASYNCDCNRGFEGDGFTCERTCYKDCIHGTCG